MSHEPIEQPGERWDTIGTIAMDAFTAVLNTDYFDCESATYANNAGAKWDKAILYGQVTGGQSGPMWVEIAVTDSVLADAAAFTALANKMNVLVVEHGDAGSENPKVVAVNTGIGRYINVRKSLAATSSAGNATFTLKARRANYMRAKNYV